MSKNNNNRFGQRFNGTLFGKKSIRDALVEMLNCFYSPTITVRTLGADGKSTLDTNAVLVMGPLGWVATIDLTGKIAAGSSSGSASVQQFKIVSDGGDYWVCKTWDGTTLGSTNVNVAKPFKLRCGTGKITSELIRGVTYTYTYTAVTVGAVTGYYTRAVSGSDGSSETDYMIPDPRANDIIYGITFTTTTPISLSAVTWLDINADGRAWAAI